MDEDIIKEISLIDPAFNSNETINYSLGISISDNSIVINILNNKNRHIYLESFKFKYSYNSYRFIMLLDSLISEQEWLKNQFASVKILYVNPKSTLIPLPLYDNTNTEPCFKFNHNLDENEDIYCDKLINLNAYNLYALDRKLNAKLKDIFPASSIFHYKSVLTENLITSSHNSDNDKKFYVNVQPPFFDIIITENKKLNYINTYKYNTPEDFIYFILYVIRELNINTETLELIFLGEIERKSPFYDIAYKYIYKIDFIERSSSFEYSYVFDNIPKHFYHNLLNLSLYQH